MNPTEFVRYFERHHPITQIRSYKDAEQFLNDALKEGNAEDHARFVIAYLGKTNPSKWLVKSVEPAKRGTVKLGVKKGGAEQETAEPAERRTNTPKLIYDLIAYADTIHDFSKDGSIAVPNIILPNGYSAKRFQIQGWESSFIRWIAKKQELTFHKNTIPNPAYGAKFLDVGYDFVKRKAAIMKSYVDASSNSNNIPTLQILLETMQKEQMIQSYRAMMSNQKVIPVDLWIQEQGKTKIFAIQQIARILCIYRNIYGPRRNIVVDACVPGYIAQLLFGIQYLSDAIWKRFRIEGTVNVAHQMDLVPLLRKEITNFLQSYNWATEDPYQWNLQTIDASIFDSGGNTLLYPLCNDPTGPIFSSKESYQIHLNRIVPGTALGSLPSIETTWVDGSLKETKTFTKQETAIFSAASISRVIDEKIYQASINKSKKVNHLRPTGPAKSLLKWSIPFLCALKRAGDWGQVEHCKKYKKIFVTADKFAALYAYVRNVETMFIKNEECVDIDIVQTRMILWAHPRNATPKNPS